ncbi:type II toxin-antitoxin system Phd/YefM family antitoxin [Georgenia sp. Z1491]|uniref:type II toxin-antitoxin system Phd/YefM family antitoxin n=1 Tax=Georgenia sp. Z1491 TaxID=3416707 RepID=UPI003CF00120
METISASAARQTLPAQLDRVAAGEEIAITRHGHVVAVLVSPEAIRARRAPEAWDQADQIGELLDLAKDAPLQPPAVSRSRAEELVDSIRADRTAR